MKTVNVNILMGLPGSGKSYWAKKYQNSNKRIFIIDMDKHIDKKTNQYKSAAMICSYYNLDLYVRDGYTLVFDGLFTTNKNVAEFLEQLSNYLNNFSSILKNITLNVYIHYWNEDREQCIKNDEYRDREISATSDIQHMPYDKLDMKYLKDKLMDKHIYLMDPKIHEVKHLNTYDQYFDPLNTKDDMYYSSTWDTGGHWGDCWGNEGSVSAEPQPEFEEFDILLEKVAPNITHLQYKRLYRECVTIEEGTDYGYYGSYTYYNRYVLDLKKCYEMLKEMGYIED